jgi:hypothetical protein
MRNRGLRINVRLLLLLAALAMLAVPVYYPAPSGAQSAKVPHEQELRLVFTSHEDVRLDPAAVALQVRTTGHLALVTPTRSFDIELMPYDMRAPGYRAESVGADGLVRIIDSGPITTYKGKVAGLPETEARFTIDDEKFEGMILTDQDAYFIESARNYSQLASASDYVLYTSTDLQPEMSRTCVTLYDQVSSEAKKIESSQAKFGLPTSEVFSPLRQAELATDADFEYVSAAGGPGAANAEILGIMNQVDAIYRRDIGVSFKVVFQHTWDTAADPYQTDGNAGAMLTEFTNYWTANFAATPRDVAHLWTGRSLGGLAGAAWNGVVCRSPRTYGISRRETSALFRVGVPAHELGHNFGANHCDGVAGCEDSIMLATQSISSNQTFCPFSINEITVYVSANSACLENVTPSPAANPIDDTAFFVRQHYSDFLGRAADQGGLDFWSNEINSCGGDPGCVANKRVAVSASFFLSIEFQQTGYLVERTYKTAYGDATGGSTCCSPGTPSHPIPVPVVRFAELIADTGTLNQGVVVGSAGWDQRLEGNKQAYFARFVGGARFTNDYPSTITPAQFVQTLNQRAGSPLSPGELATLIAEHTAGAKNRAVVLRQIAEHPNLVNAEFNRAFVLMQYIGYMRRSPNDPPDPDHSGYEFWLNKLNAATVPGEDPLVRVNRAEMVKAFIESIEYRKRFGP